MNLLVRAARDLTRLVSPELGFTVVIAGMVVALEALGRQSSTDLHDLLALIAVVMLGVLINVRHRRAPLSWVSAISRTLGRLGERLKQSTFEIGLDLRGEPRVKHGAPPIVMYLALGLAVWTVLAAFFAAECPRDLRALAVRFCYVAYLVPLAILWVGSILLILLSAFLPAAMIHDTFVAAHTAPGARPRRREFVTVLAYFVTLTLIGTFFPIGVSLLVCAMFLAIYLILCRLPARTSVRFLWRRSGTVRVRSLTWSDWVTWEFLLISLALFALVLTSCGDRLWNAAAQIETMPVTALLGMGLAWLAPGALGALLLQMTLGRLRDPARAARPTAHLANVEGWARRVAMSALFARHGWRLRFGPKRPRHLDVRLHLTDTPVLGGSDAASWPLVISPAELDDPALWERIARRNEIQLRRKLLSSLERLFKLAASRNTRSGSGYWVAPHFWFVPGLMRDCQRDADEELDFADQALLSGTVGPPYHRLLPRAVRHHFWTILRALQVDLIFVEDGVGFRRLRRVLRVLFEVFDVHAGRRAASEIDFRGLPGVRVLIHEFQFDEPFKSEVYPEPKYDYLGRARILHIFRDRGGHEERVEPPFDASRSPAPAAMG
jgi:hypothetical protein